MFEKIRGQDKPAIIPQAQLEAQQKALRAQKQGIATDNKPRPPATRKPAYPKQGMGVIPKLLIGVAIFGALILGGIVGSTVLGGGVHYERDALNLNPFLVVIIVVAAILIGAALGALLELGVLRWKVPETFLFAKIRFGGNILHRQIGLQGREVWRPARVDQDGQYLEVQLGNMWVPVSVNPGILGGNKTSYHNGLMIVDNVTNNIMPINILDEVGLYQLQDFYKDPANSYKVLQFYKPGVVAYLYNCPPSDLDQHCALHISVDPSVIDLPYLLKNGYLVPLENETTEALVKRLQGDPGTVKKIVDTAYADLCKYEKDTLKAEVMRLKDETRDFYIQDGVFLRYACAEALDQRLATDTAETIQRIERNKQNRPAAKQGLPDWIKWLLFLLGGCVGFGLLAYLVSMAVSKLAGG